MLVEVVLHALWRKGGKSGKNLEYQGLSTLAMKFKQTEKNNSLSHNMKHMIV